MALASFHRPLSLLGVCHNMNCTSYQAGYISQSRELEGWENASQYAPTPGNFRSPYAMQSECSPSPSISLEEEPNVAGRLQPNNVPLLQESDWDADKIYDEYPPRCIHYFIEWRVALNNEAVKLQTVLEEKVGRNKRVRVDDTAIVVAVNDRSQRDLTKRFNKTEIAWAPIKKQLRMWSSHFCRGKRLTLRICFNYGGILETHRDVPEEIRDELYMEEQQKQEKEKRKGSNILGDAGPYQPININVHPSHPTSLAPTTPADATAELRAISPLNIPGLKDVAVKEYGEWLASNVSDNTLKDEFRQACDITLSDGFELGHIFKDQNPSFFVEKGIKPGIARSSVENIRDWVENVKRVMPIVEMV
ncbi:hypothetical protein PENARI_c092G02062 [Penicillium arizonense]|uniref:Uncharacterized protein n=1 Tax=Penicillium arizonense TaxID=1835702 RepID=A0A1F5L1I3_PENAI|nr:hypothetical protein PENARI_c092G02062 [Penicillium arizonense]OGE46897.1 hypothetical protein PENARI_c092G02062 [Penicillium arizonense]